jgi:small subunit ribosomal protein S2
MDEAVSIKELLEAGVHFGHSSSRWNPKMAPYIFGKHNRVHIIDLEKTQAGLKRALVAVRASAERGEDILFVGTKPQAKDIIAEEAQRCSVCWVTERWIGGLLTNFPVISSRITRLSELERVLGEAEAGGLSKKERSRLEREFARLNRLLAGVREMDRLPGLLYLVDIGQEATALAEARRMRIPVVAIVDTNVDPGLVDYPIPGNDDARRAITLITHQIVQAILEGRAGLEVRGP